MWYNGGKNGWDGFGFMNQSFTDKRSLIYDCLKAITILLVLAGHCFVMYSPDGAIEVVKGCYPFRLATLVIYRFHVPCFFMVSGAIFALCLRQRVYADFRTFLRKKARRLLIPYGIFGLLVVPPVLALCGLAEDFSLPRLGWQWLSGMNMRHLWYLYALFFIFLLMWAVRKYLVPTDGKRVLLISFVVSLIFRSFSPVWLSYFQIANIFYYQFFFVCGVYLDFYFEELFALLAAKKKWSIAVLALLLCSTFADFWTLSGYVYALCGMALSLWLGLWLSERRSLLKSSFHRLLCRDSYGIYLIHAMLVYLVFWSFSEVAVSPLLLVALAFSVALGGSLGLTELLRRLGLGFVLGEGKRR